MANWHVDLYGIADDEEAAQDAVDALVSMAENDYGLTAHIAQPEPTPAKPAPTPAAKPAAPESQKK